MGKEKKKIEYQELEITIIEFDAQDVITASNGDDGRTEFPDDYF